MHGVNFQLINGVPVVMAGIELVNSLPENVLYDICRMSKPLSLGSNFIKPCMHLSKSEDAEIGGFIVQTLDGHFTPDDKDDCKEYKLGVGGELFVSFYLLPRSHSLSSMQVPI